MKHERFNRLVWVFKSDLTGALAKWLVKQSPYTVPDKLSDILIEFERRIPYTFDINGMAKISLSNMTHAINEILESIPDVMALNVRKNNREGMGFVDRYSELPDPDDDFIDIMALAQNITCEFADQEDTRCWLDAGRTSIRRTIRNWCLKK